MHQGQGFGTMVLEDAYAIAKECPADSVRLDAFAADAGAGGLYARCGFTQRGSSTRATRWSTTSGWCGD